MMYGTVARMKVKPGAESALRRLSEESAQQIPGIVGEYIYRMDAEPNVYYMALVFASQEAYVANANSAEQHKRYERYREFLAADPEWHDGEIVYTYTPA
jgi:quinol monooxygenase YgiN